MIAIEEVLGLEGRVRTPLDLVDLGAKGVLKKQVKHLGNVMCITSTTLAKLLAITPRTIQRQPEEKRFDRVVSERAINLAQLIVKGIELFKDKDEFCAWLQAPCLALGSRTPISLLTSSVGVGMVNDLLGRMEYGVFS